MNFSTPSPFGENSLPRQPRSFDARTFEEIQTHFQISTYHAFRLPDAVRPSYDLQVVPTEGFQYRSRHGSSYVVAALSAEKIFGTFLDALDMLGETWDTPAEQVNAVLESTHHRRASWEAPRAFFRTEVDLPLFKSILRNHETSFLADGCSSLSVLNVAQNREIRLDEHKLFFFFGENLAPFAHFLLQHDISYRPHFAILPDAEHVHLSSDRLEESFFRLVDSIV